jgi:Uma2 family endonuclease
MADLTKPAGQLVFSPEDELPAAPTVEAWRAMTAEQRLDFQVAVNESLSASAALMPEGRPHKITKIRVIDALGLHFKTLGRSVYLAEDLAVHYPGEKPFSPDVLAVLNVEQPKVDKRMAWVVADEGKGPEFVLEVLHHGDRKKDLVANVERYASLGIQEYFVYDGVRRKIHGWHLPGSRWGQSPQTPGPGASGYQHKVPQGGHYRSDVLGVDLAIFNDALQFLVGEAALPVSADLIARLQGDLENLEARAAQAQAQVEQAQAQAEAKGFREAIVALLQARAIPFADEARTRVEACTETPTLRRWMLRATTAGSITEVFSEGSPPNE